MKLRNKVFIGFCATVLALIMMVGTVFASTSDLPYNFPTKANAPSESPVWVKLIGADDENGKQISDADTAHKVRSVDVYFKGKCSFTASIIYNSNLGWNEVVKKEVTVKGTKKLTAPMDGTDTNWCECVVNCNNKTKGKLSIAKMVFKDASGKALVTIGK